MTKVKICGITNIEDARRAVEFGADILGFNFCERSSRLVTSIEARGIIKELPENTLKVGVFVNEDLDSIAETVGTAGLGAVQLHGEESPHFAHEVRRLVGCPVIKAFRVMDPAVADYAAEWDVDAILLDGFSPIAHGGTGETFDWAIAAQVSASTRLYLAGGLSAENVRSAVSQVRPYAVDACSLLESTPGRKDPDKLRRFIMEAKYDD